MRVLEEIVGNTAMLQTVRAKISDDTFPHAAILSGPKGIGKRTAALAMARELLSRGGSESDLVSVTNLIDAGNHPDLHFITCEEGKRDISVDAVRALIANLHLKPYLGRAAVAVIDNAERLTIAACNALLMTLEEPRAGRYLILVTDTPHLLTPTVISRCQIFNFERLSADELRTVLLSLNLQSDAKLTEHLEGRLEHLQLDRFIDGRSSRVIDQRQLEDHFLAQGTLISTLERLSEGLVEHAKTPAVISNILELSSKLAAEKGSAATYWNSIRKSARRALLQGDPRATRFWASLILELVETERGVTERNLNPEVQLSSLLSKHLLPLSHSDRI